MVRLFHRLDPEHLEQCCRRRSGSVDVYSRNVNKRSTVHTHFQIGSDLQVTLQVHLGAFLAGSAAGGGLPANTTQAPAGGCCHCSRKANPRSAEGGGQLFSSP